MFATQNLHPAQVSATEARFAEMAQSWRAVARRSEAGARAEAEERVFNQMVVALHASFAHRLQARDCGPALEEVRLLALGITGWNGFFPDHGAGSEPLPGSVTGYAPGDRIRMTERSFSNLAARYLQGIAALMDD